MRAGQPSQTAVLVCMARAAAHGRTSVRAFSDPAAMALLPAEAQARVQLYRSGARPRGLRARLRRKFFEGRMHMMVARTVFIDEALRSAPAPQVVILGAGLDGRAWRMPELRDTVVFEVDHPDSQRDKQARLGALTQSAREVRFVPIDFTRDDLGAALAAAGHDASRPTFWIWEGVVMYLALPDIESTLRIIQQRSARHSRLCVAYFQPAPMLGVIGWMVRRLGEPLRSSFTETQMRSLLGKHAFTVSEDKDLPTVGRGLGQHMAAATRRLKHTRLVVAVRT